VDGASTEDRTAAASAGGEGTRPLAPVHEPVGILRWLYRRFFSHIHVDARWSDAVRDAAQRGVVVYVMRSLSFLDFLCLDFLTKQFGLPLLRFVNDLGLWILEPFGRGGRRLRFRRQVPEEQALTDVLRSKASALLFLRKPPTLTDGLTGEARRGKKPAEDLLRTLVAVQRQLDAPILLVPQTFVWSKLPPRKKRSILDLVFGPSEWPGKIRVFMQFLLNYRNALLRTGDPFDLRAFLEQNQDLTDAQVADKVRYALLRRMERERTLVLGPGQKSPQRIREEILRSPRVRRHVEAHARAKGVPVAAALREADRELRKLCAAPDPNVIGLLHRVLDRVWNRIYDGLVVDEEGVERVREAARRGNIVLVPSHKSHVDYLVLSDVLFTRAMSPPLIAAGDNLAFFPLGPVLRRGGAFFIRRSFKGRKMYSALVDAYMRKLLVEGFTVEFFIEGGRSRTGKLLPPKLGLLSMIVDAALQIRQRPTHFVPVSIGYERVIEERAYVHELGGGEKQKEDVKGLLATPRILRARYGRLYIQFGEVLRLDDVAREVVGEDAHGDPTRSELRPSERRALVQKLAHRITYEIDRVTVATPAALVATVLLTHRRRGIRHDDLLEGARDVLRTLRRLGARVVPPMVGPDGELREDAVAETVRLFLDGKLIVAHGRAGPDGSGPDGRGTAIYGVPDDRRTALEYYKNNILHFFVARALIAAALSADGGEPVSEVALRERVRDLSRLFKYEFMFRADAPFEEIFEDALAGMLADGEVERCRRADLRVETGRPNEPGLASKPHEPETAVRAGAGSGGRRVAFYTELLRAYVEGYRVALRGAELLVAGPMQRKDWVKKTLALGERLFLAGDVEVREAVTRTKLENALLALRDRAYVTLDGDWLRAGPALASDGGVPTRDPLRRAAAQLAGYAR
jgi:glycerol-3-phosphate O-acyltransferase